MDGWDGFLLLIPREKLSAYRQSGVLPDGGIFCLVAGNGIERIGVAACGSAQQKHSLCGEL